MLTYHKISARQKWFRIGLVSAIPVIFILIIPYTRAILFGFLTGQSFTYDLRPLRYHTNRLLTEDPKKTFDSLSKLLRSDRCARAASPELVRYFQSLRQQGLELRPGTLEAAWELVDKSSQGSLEKPVTAEGAAAIKALAPILGEMLQCEGDGNRSVRSIYQARILDKVVAANADDPSIRAAAAKLLWDDVPGTIDAAAAALNRFDREQLKEELLRMLQSDQKTKQQTACEYIAAYCPDLEEAAPQLRKLGSGGDKRTMFLASDALRRIEEHQRKHKPK
jgi:hypothetical protein